MAYWWTILSVFDASAPPVFAAALIKTYEVHEEDVVRRCFFSVTRDEQNHEQMCGLAITKLLGHPDAITYVPKTEIGRKLQKMLNGYITTVVDTGMDLKNAVPKYSLAVLFSSFLMGEMAAATIFHQMAAGCKELVFKEGFSKIGKDEGRHMAIVLTLMERDYPTLCQEDKEVITKQIRAGYLFLSAVLFEPPAEFWDIPADFIENQREGERHSREAGFDIPEYEVKKENWKKAMLNLKSVLDKYDTEFPAIPEVGITGKEVTDLDMEDIIPVF